MTELSAIPTHVITGFLGVGKSTAILSLLERKPESERWAVLVNEFGEVGIDGELLQGEHAESSGVFIREVPGGCMCCAADLPMQIALNQLLSRAKPDRLLIEPTGLGHPAEVLAILQAPHYASVLDIRATLTLVDARKISDPRYTEHDVFNQQLDIADVLVANKTDQYAAQDYPALCRYLDLRPSTQNTPRHQTQQGHIELEWLETPPRAHHTHSHDHAHGHSDPWSPTVDIPEAGFVSIENQGEGYFSRGWVFAPEWTFKASELLALLSGIAAERIKGVFITERGAMSFNVADGVMSTRQLDECMDSRVECIGRDPEAWAQLEAHLLACADQAG